MLIAFSIILIGVILLLVVGYLLFKEHPKAIMKYLPEKTLQFVRIRKIESYEDGQNKKFDIDYIEDIKDGDETLYYPSGEINRTRHWTNGELNGESSVYYPNGQLYISCTYRMGKLHGDYVVYRQDGSVLLKKNY